MVGCVRAAARAVRGLAQSTLAAAFPIGCAACAIDRSGTWRDSADPAADPADPATPERAFGWPLCEGCDRFVVSAGEPFCLTCVDRGGEPRRCRASDHLRLRAAFLWTDPVRAVVHAFKFEGADDLATALVDRAWRTPGWAGAPRPEAIVPVPLHPARRRERGYDQAVLLARRLGERVGAPDVAVLARIRCTRQQARLSSRERRENVRQAFSLVRPELVRGRAIALIDDVVTTGATLEATARALEPGRPSGLEAWCLAYDPGPG